MTSKGKRSHLKLRSACVVALALTGMPVLMAQEDGLAQIRTRAMALEQEGRNAEAERIWDGIAKAYPRNAEALAHLGLLEARQERYETAIDHYRQATAIDSDLPGLQINLGLALFKAAQFPDAIETFSAEIKKHPSDLRLTILLGMAHYGMKDYLVAIPYLQRATERDPQNIPLRMTLAHTCMWSKQYQCVLNVQQQILSLQGESAEVDTLASEAFDQMRDGIGAEKELRAAILANPKEPNVHFGLGYLLRTHGQWTEAAQEFQRELENNPEHLKARIYLADAQVRQSAFAKALPELEKLVVSNQSEPLVHHDLGILYANAGRNDDAIRELKSAIKFDPDDFESRLEIVKLYRSMGRMEEENAELNQIKDRPPRTSASLQEMIDSIENPAP